MRNRYRKELKIENFKFECGAELPLTLAFETFGELNSAGDNVVLICHTLTSGTHLASHPGDEKPGWWSGMVGSGENVDTKENFVICVNVPGSCYGSTGPSSENPKTGEPYGMDFPPVTVGDMVEAEKTVLEHLGINRLKCVIGASIGGQQALEWTARFPKKIKKSMPIATAAKVSPQIIGLTHSAQKAIRSDPRWRDGNYYGRTSKPEDGLAIARQIGHITYLSRQAMEEKFGRRREKESGLFEVEKYLEYKGKKFTERFDPNSYLRLTDAMIKYEFPGPPEGVPEEEKPEVYLVSIESDWHFTVEETRRLENAFARSGIQVRHETMESSYGHDAFLVEPESLKKFTRNSLKDTRAKASSSKE